MPLFNYCTADLDQPLAETIKLFLCSALNKIAPQYRESDVYNKVQTTVHQSGESQKLLKSKIILAH